MDLFELAARLTLDVSEYETKLDQAAQAVNTFAALVQTGLGAAAGVGQGALEALGGAVDGLTGTLQTGFLPGAQTVLDRLGSLFGPGEGSGISLILSGITGLAGRISESYPALQTAGDGAVNTVLTAISGRLPEFLSYGGAMASQLGSGLSSAWAKLSTATAPLIETVQAAFAASDWWSVGSGVAAGIASGISGGVSLITSAAKTVASNALAAAKNLLGIASPSRVFRDQVGAQIASGVAAGMLDGLGAVQSAADRLADAALVSAGLNVTGSLVGLAGDGSGAGSVSRYGMNMEHGPMYDGTVNIVVQSVLDGKVIGENSYRYWMDKQRMVGR